MRSPLALALAVSAALPAHAAGFADGTVNPASYTVLSLHTDVGVSVAPQAVASGNPGDALALHYTNTGAPINLLSIYGFVYDAFSWNPATQGAVASLAFSNDRYVDGGDDFININLITFSRALVVQGGQAYVAALFDAGQPRQAWYTTSAPALTAADFVALDFNTGATNAALHPDFSAGGGMLGFGFVNRFLLDSAGSPYNVNATFAYDNIVFELTTLPVPEPASAGLLAGGLLLLALRRLRPA